MTNAVGYDAYVGTIRVGSTAATSYEFQGLSCGTTYTLSVDSYNVRGYRSALTSILASTGLCAPSPATTPPDTAAPSVPTNLTVGNATSTAIALFWGAATDNTGVAGYDIARNGNFLDTTAGTSYIASGLSCGTSYTLSVDSFDAAGNHSASASLVASTSACPDTTPPTVPTALTTTSSTTSVTLGWTASTDAAGVTGYDVRVGGSNVASTTATSYTFGGLACETTYTVGVVAYDAAGNRSSTASTSVTTGACAPSTTSTNCARYASTDGSDSNSGTLSAPFRTPQQLIDSLGPGDVGCLRGGTYTTATAYIANFSTGGTSTAPIIVQSYPGETATLVGIVQVKNGADNVVLSRLHFQGDGSGGNNTIKIYASDDVLQDSDITNNWLGRSCLMLGSPSAGQATRPVVRRNRFHECGNPANGSLDHAIYADVVLGGNITDNVFWNSAAYTIQLYPDAQGTTFAHNVVDGSLPSVRGGVVFGGDSSYASSNNVVEYNVIANAQTYDVTSTWSDAAGTGNVARNNCVYAGSGGLIFTGNGGFTATNNVTANPLFVNQAVHDYRLQAGSPCLAVVGYDTAARLG